MHLLPVLVV